MSEKANQEPWIPPDYIGGKYDRSDHSRTLRKSTAFHDHRFLGYYAGVRCMDLPHLAKEIYPDDPPKQTEWIYTISQLFGYDKNKQS